MLLNGSQDKNKIIQIVCFTELSITTNHFNHWKLIDKRILEL
jgi:hypothetical protein